MGLLKIIKKTKAQERELRLLILGLDNAGKTTILYKLALDEVIVTEPTIGSNVEEVSHKNLKL